MSRLRRFCANAGAGGVVRASVIGLIAVLIASGELADGSGYRVVPILLGTFFASYPARHWMVDHVTLVRGLMNGAAVLAGIIVLVCKMAGVEKLPGLSLAACAFLGGYMGLYFWLLSDPRIERYD